MKKAFTLAEVLITLAIIGVVAAMTIPTLISKYQEKQTVTQLTKVYSILSQAWQLMQTEYGTIDTWGMTSTNTGQIDPETGKTIYNHSAQSLIGERLRKYLKVSRVCSPDAICIPQAQYALNGQERYGSGWIVGTSDAPADSFFYLTDGTLLATAGWFSAGINNMDIIVYLPNAKKQVLGKSQFYFVASKDGVKPEGYKEIVNNSFGKCDPNGTDKNAGRGCTAWVIYNKKYGLPALS